jgi:O-antigen/teichoic acid export membrane protein
VAATSTTPAPEADPAPIPGHAGLARQTLIYGLAGVAPQVVGILTVPIFARAFVASQYGALEIALVSLSVAATAADAGLASASQRSFYDYRDDQNLERRAVVTTAVAAAAAVSITLALLAVLLRGWLSELLFGSAGHEHVVVLIALTVPALVLGTLLRETMRLRFLAGHYLVSALVTAAVGAGIGVFAVVALDAGVTAVIAGLLAANVAAAAYGAVAMRRDLGRSLSRFELRRMLAFGLPLVPAALALWALALIDRLMLSGLADLDEVGKYAVANRVASVIQLGTTGFLLALGPYLLSIFAESRELEKIVRGRTLTYLAFTLAAAGLVVTLFSKEAVDVLAPGYGDAYLAVGPIAFGWVAFGIASLLMAGISLARRTVYFAVLAGAAAVLNIGLNLVLIPAWGMVGAALATAAAYAALAALYYVFAQRVYPTQYEPRKVLMVLVLAAVWAIPGVFEYDSEPLAVLVKLGALAGFAVTVLVTPTVGMAEFRELARFLRGMVSLRRRPA